MALLKRISVLVAVAAVLAASVAAETTAPSPAIPSSPLDKAKALFDQGKYADAVVVLDKIASSDPTAPEALKMMGDCYKAQRNWAQAIKYFEKALACPNAPLQTKEIRTQLMDCYFADNATSRGYACLDRLVADYPDDAARFHYVVGRRYQWMHQYAEAAKELREAVKLPPTDPDAKDAGKRYICCCLSAMDFDGALAYLPMFVSNYPDSIPEVVSKELYRWKFKVPQVIDIVEKAIVSTSNDTTEMRIGLADCRVATNSWDKALAVLNGIQTGKRSANWHVAMAKCCWGQNKQSEAVEELEQAIKMGSGLDSKKLLMEYYRDMGDSEHMLAQAQLLVREWPENAGEWLMNQGWALLEMDRCEEAVPVFREAISRYPDNRWVIRGSLVSLGECLYRLGKEADAVAALEGYYKQRPELKSEYLLVYAQVLRYGPHDTDRSVAMLNKLIGDYPTDPMAYEARKFLPGVLQASGKYDEVVEMLQSQLNAVPSWREWDKLPLQSRIADAYLKAKNYARAAEAYRELSTAAGSTREAQATAMYHLGVCQQEMGRNAEARHTYTTVLGRDGVPDRIRAKTMTGLALCYWHIGLKNAARRLMQDVSNRYGDMEEAMNARGYLHIWTEVKAPDSQARD